MTSLLTVNPCQLDLASSCASGLFLISGSTIFPDVEASSVAFFEALIVDIRLTSLVDRMAFKALVGSTSNPFMPSSELS